MKKVCYAWIKASRLPSQLYICLPLLAGQVYAMALCGTFDLFRLIFVQLYGIAIQLCIVYSNDYADVGADVLNSTYTPFSGGSRVLVDGDISRRALGIAGLTTAFLSLAIGLLLSRISGSMYVLLLSVCSLLLLYAYSYPPFRINYRGGGELLQMAGTGLVLPLIGWTAQSGSLAGFPNIYFVFLLPTMLACGIATSLPDEPADIAASKRSASALMGQRRAQLVVIFLNLFSLAALFVLVPDLSFMQRCLLSLLPVAAIAGQLRFYGAQPGKPEMLMFVALSIAVTLAITTMSFVAHLEPHYSFLILNTILAVPALFLFLLAPGAIKRAAYVTALFSLPFALFEGLFVPEYWSPAFIGNLNQFLGFGIEDFLFVAELAVIATAIYPVIFKKTFGEHEPELSCIRRTGPFLTTIGGLLALLALGVPVIAATLLAMMIFSICVLFLRSDLAGASVVSGLLTALIYWAACLLLRVVIPGVFMEVWNSSGLIGVYLLGIPLEEVGYGFAAGVCAGIFYLFCFNKRLVSSGIVGVERED